ncbi:pentapeptide repeat-containing protein [Roseibium album]|uniref:pentapeptide repeat-containing protein n=1 Tax=Roseibium album TaxID=311410 RepID=UPI002493CA3B|nr:pentapeptide repeat-containing protein [Roseibium album]
MVEVQGVDLATELPKEFDAKLAHIDAVSKNARGTWLSLIAVLLFSAITVAGVRDQDYFIYDSALVLPVISVSVPIKSFFYAGPLIVLGLYTYLHLYLIKLWRALATIDAQPARGVWLDDLVFPWLISDAAIFLKPGAPKRPFRWLTRLVSFSFLWAAAPLVLLLFWFRSFPPHDGWLTAWTGAMVALSVLGGSISHLLWHRILRTGQENSDRAFWAGQIKPLALVWAIFSGVLLIEGWEKSTGGIQTEQLVLGDADNLYPTHLYRADIVERPKDWLPYEEALEEFKVKYSGVRRKDLEKAEHKDADWVDAAETAFRNQRKNLLSKLRANDFPNAKLSKANLKEAFLPGLDLYHANIQGADLSGATMEGADLRLANLRLANLSGADLSGADLYWANLSGADLSGAHLGGADLGGADLSGADLSWAHLGGADLGGADLSGADLSWADLSWADTFGGSFSGALLVSADLSVNDFVTQLQINSAYGDGSTKLPRRLDRPQHWPEGVLIPSDVNKRWLAWREDKDK